MADFNGYWKIDLDRSRVWDTSSDAWVPDPVGREEIWIETDGDTHRYENVLRLNPSYRLGYTVRYGDNSWTPYMVLETVDDAESRAPNAATSGDTRRIELKVGEPLSLVSLVRIDASFHYRISKNLDGTPGYVLQRRIEDGGRTFTSTVFTADGKLTLIKVFNRVG